MTRRFEVGPVLVALGALVLLVSLFLEWYGQVTAWDVFEVVDLLLAVLAVAALVAAVGLVMPNVESVERPWLPVIVLAIAVVVAAQVIDPPPVAGGEGRGTGAWMAFASAALMFVGAVLTVGRLSFSVAVEGREPRERVAVVDQRQDTTETAPVVPPAEGSRQAKE